MSASQSKEPPAKPKAAVKKGFLNSKPAKSKGTKSASATAAAVSQNATVKQIPSSARSSELLNPTGSVAHALNAELQAEQNSGKTSKTTKQPLVTEIGDDGEFDVSAPLSTDDANDDDDAASATDGKHNANANSKAQAEKRRESESVESVTAGLRNISLQSNDSTQTLKSQAHQSASAASSAKQSDAQASLMSAVRTRKLAPPKGSADLPSPPAIPDAPLGQSQPPLVPTTGNASPL